MKNFKEGQYWFTRDGRIAYITNVGADTGTWAVDGKVDGDWLSWSKSGRFSFLEDKSNADLVKQVNRDENPEVFL